MLHSEESLLPELWTEDSVNDRIESGVEVTQPQEETGGSRQWFHAGGPHTVQCMCIIDWPIWIYEKCLNSFSVLHQITATFPVSGFALSLGKLGKIAKFVTSEDHGATHSQWQIMNVGFMFVLKWTKFVQGYDTLTNMNDTLYCTNMNE